MVNPAVYYGNNVIKIESSSTFDNIFQLTFSDKAENTGIKKGRYLVKCHFAIKFNRAGTYKIGLELDGNSDDPITSAMNYYDRQSTEHYSDGSSIVSHYISTVCNIEKDLDKYTYLRVVLYFSDETIWISNINRYITVYYPNSCIVFVKLD